MTIQQIIYALTIAETKSMNKAAEKLFISQPSLTGIEKELWSVGSIARKHIDNSSMLGESPMC